MDYKKLREEVREKLKNYYHSLTFNFANCYFDYKIDMETGDIHYTRINGTVSDEVLEKIDKIVIEEIKERRIK